jgi:hypothetical protein
MGTTALAERRLLRRHPSPITVIRRAGPAASAPDKVEQGVQQDISRRSQIRQHLLLWVDDILVEPYFRVPAVVWPSQNPPPLDAGKRESHPTRRGGVTPMVCQDSW